MHAGRFIVADVDGKAMPVPLEEYKARLAARLVQEVHSLAAWRPCGWRANRAPSSRRPRPGCSPSDLLRAPPPPGKVWLPPHRRTTPACRVLRERIGAAERACTAAGEELDTINALPAALLRRAFAGTPEMRNTDGRLGTDGHGQTQTREEGLLPRYGGYRNTKTYQLAELIYDITVRFCDKFVDRRSRTHDQMVQAARSGSRNLSEGSMDSATSKKIEMKLTGIALGSLDELRRDYVAFLRQRGLPEWPPDHPALVRLKAMRCATLEEFRAWVADEVRRAKLEGVGGPENTDRPKNTDRHGQARPDASASAGRGGAGDTLLGAHTPSGVRVRPCMSVSPVSVSPQDLPAVLAANGALCLLNLCMYLVKRQLEAQARAFEQDGGFTERLYRRRSETRRQGTTEHGGETR